MRLKISLAKEPKHKDIVSAVGWATSDEVLSCGDDHVLMRWNLVSGENSALATLPDTLFPTDVHWYPRGLAGGSKKGGVSDLFILTSTEGKFYLISKSGRVEKTVEAHKGAVLSARWSYDGTSLLTVGEDGAVKVWSRSGMLRSTLSQNSSPVYSGCWSPDNNQILYSNGKQITIKSLQANAKPTQWKGHDGVILSLDWNPCSNLIISGGEDCKYKVWDSFGRPVFSSHAHEFPITSVSWANNGELFAVGSFNTLRLCDKAGWSHSLDKPRTGSVFNIRWSPDGTQVAGACGSGHVVFANVIEKRAEWHNFESVQTKRKTVEIRDVLNNSKERLELRDRVTNMALGWGHLVVATATQCCIFRAFLMVDGGTVTIHGYDGRIQCSIKFSGMRTDVLSDRSVGLSNDTVVVKDKSDEKLIHVFDAGSGKPLGDGKITHTQEIMELAIDQCGHSNERRVAFIDKNNDLFLSSVKTYGSGQKIVKLSSMIHNIRFNDTTNMLVGLQDSKLLVWCYPSTAYVDKELLSKTVIEKETKFETKEKDDFGKAPFLLSFLGCQVTVRRTDGSLISTGISPFPAALHGYIEKHKWDHALKLCRHIRDDKLWATLAAMAAYAKNLNTAEIAYSAINEAEKVHYLNEIRAVSNKDIRNAELSLLCGNAQEAEGIFLQSGHIFRAIMMNVTLYRWDRAMELAAKHKMHVDTVLGYRQKFLDEFDRKETKPLFKQYAGEVGVFT